jgi:uncharacterized BrkB/YihY/UPF0761 family membrane protein
MKKLKKFISSKGGIYAIIGTISLLIIASFLIIVGVIYGTYGGNWGKIGEVLSSKFAIGVYVIIGLVIFFLIYIAIIFKRNEEIK